VLNVTAAATVNGLNSAIAKVGSMSFLGTALTTKDKLDLSAYIASAR
jgi:hypothetical protein